MHAATDFGEHYLYLSTPSTTTISINIKLGNGQFARDANGRVLDNIQISNASPERVYFGNADIGALVPFLTRVQDLGKPLDDKGLVVRGSSVFYCNYRVKTNIQGASLTSKGQTALGTSFRIGHIEGVRLTTNTLPRSNFYGVMATEDDTEVILSDHDQNIRFQSSTGLIDPGAEHRIVLQKGQSYVMSLYYNPGMPPSNANGMMGALLESTKPIAVSCGSWLGSPFNFSNQDIGIDQIVPLNIIGYEYILVRGDGPNSLETPLVIATEDGTTVRLNDETTDFATLNAGDWIRIPESKYSGFDNLYIKATHPVYVYQMLAGADDTRTGGLNFVPPLGCSDESAIDNIMDIDQIGSQLYEGKLFIVAEKDKPVYINGSLINPGILQPVSGNFNYTTYKAANLSGNVSVNSEGSLQVGIYGRNAAAGWAGYFSGFQKIKLPDVEIITHKRCDGTIYVQNSGELDSLGWFYNGIPLNIQNDTIFQASPGRYFVIGQRTLCEESYRDTSEIIIVPEPLSYSVSTTPLPCKESQLGMAVINDLKGGYPPYEVFFNGIIIDPNEIVDSLNSGWQYILIKDQNGCRYTDSVWIKVEDNLPEFNFIPPDTITCKNKIVEIEIIISEPSLYDYEWTTKIGKINGSNQSQDIVVSKGGYYFALVTNRETGCSKLDSILINEDVGQPSIDLTNGNKIDCYSPELTLFADFFSSESEIKLTWSTMDGKIIWDKGDSIAVSTKGTYQVIIENNKNGCLDTASIVVDENNEVPKIRLLPDTLTCLKTELLVPGWVENQAHTIYQWKSTHGGIVNGKNSKDALVNLGGVYRWIVFDTLNGCSDSLDIEIFQDTVRPDFDLKERALLTCRDSQYRIQIQGISESKFDYEWTRNGFSFEPGSNPLEFDIKESGVYALKVVDASNGCFLEREINVERADRPVEFDFDFIMPDCHRRKGELQIGNVVGGVEPYIYSIDGGATYHTEKEFVELDSGEYKILVKDNNDCILTDSIEVVTFDPIKIEILETYVELELGDQHQFITYTNIPDSDIDSIIWNPGLGLSCLHCLDPLLAPFHSKDYWIDVWDIHGCHDRARLRVRVDRDVDVFIPNVFTPNGDLINDGFTAFSKDKSVRGIHRMMIFDRWGELTFLAETIPINSPEFGWQGDLNGRPFALGVFAYLIEIEYIDGSRKLFSGDVTLLR